MDFSIYEKGKAECRRAEFPEAAAEYSVNPENCGHIAENVKYATVATDVMAAAEISDEMAVTDAPVTIDATAADFSFMREAIAEARRGAELGEVPVGAVIVRDGEIIARAHNRVELDSRSDAHAEMLALAEAENKSGKWLPGATMYVTLEPCSMCAGALVLARIDRLVFGACDPKTGACGSTINVPGNASLNHRIEITGGVLAEECGGLLKDFFRMKRGSK